MAAGDWWAEEQLQQLELPIASDLRGKILEISLFGGDSICEGR